MYRFLNHTADVMFEVEAITLEELFEDAAKALMEVMVDLKTVKASKKKVIKIKAAKLDELLYNFLEKLVFLKDAEYMLFSQFKVVKVDIKKFELIVNIWGEKINNKRHNLGVDVKAVTLHDYAVEFRGLESEEYKDEVGWYAKILLDI